MFKKILSFVVVAALSTVCASANRPADNNSNANHTQVASINHADYNTIVGAAGMEMLFDDEEVNPMANDLLAYAKKFMGTRYVRGGKGPKGFDCSGFTSYVFRQFGVALGASSRDQYLQGDKVDRLAVQPGDLLFFKGRAAKSSTVGHVGIAIEADPETGVITFIHAATSGGIRIDKTSAPYYAARYIGARRVLDRE